MGRYFIKFSYLGTQYRGIQKNVIKDTYIMLNDPDTVQGALETAFTILIPKCIHPPRMYCSSRTDVGVHALGNIGQVDLINKYNVIYNPEEALKYINRYLLKCNHDIRLLEFVPVQPNFQAKHIIKSRTYVYRFMIPKNKDNHKIPIMERSYCHYLRSDDIDIERLRNGLKLFLRTQNFQTFSAKKIDSRPINYVRKLNVLTLEKGQPFMPLDPLSQDFDFWNIVCSSKGFLYKQVRRIVSALFALATGKLTERDITIMLQVPGHHNWPSKIQPVPGHGLFLANIEYCQEDLDQYKIEYETDPNHRIVIPVEGKEVNYAKI
ncbi:tRNA pseudouridine synthase-like 1 isoform X1 [Megachile rotundata]|uniref:tRNA pseudouridine synthase-like 1 isoform X1 n=3 Tax=Megachile rotundata TaxID=143995 RepID=UPI003FD24D94